MPEPTDPWWETIRSDLQETLDRLDVTDRKEARLIAVHVSTALDCVDALRRDDRAAAP